MGTNGTRHHGTGHQDTVLHRRQERARRTTTVAGLVLALAIAVGACTAADDSSTASEPATETSGRFASDDSADAPTTGDLDTDVTEAGGGRDAAPSMAAPGFDLGTIGRQVIVEMRVSMVSEDLRATVEGITRAAATQGGGVAATDVDYGSTDDEGRPRGDGYAVIVAKVPPAALSSFVSGLDRLGTVTNIGQDAQDVTDQLTDLDVRIQNARASVERVRALLADAATMRDVIELESELTRRQTDLERLEATKRNLADRVALSTVTIEVYTDAPDPGAEADEGDGVGDAFTRGLEAFGGVVLAIVTALALAAPFLALGIVVLVVAWFVVRRRRRARPARPEAAAPTTSDPRPAPPVEVSVGAPDDDATRPG